MHTNTCISCTVNECKFHATNENYCTLEKIQVGKGSCDTTSCSTTECDSFQCK